MTRALVLLTLCVGLAGCAVRTVPQTVKVPVPIECRAETPARPAMPSESLSGTEALDHHVKTLHAEIELREGYEIQLAAALASCKRPVAPPE